ncbi:MAG: flippase-like domain-containing protein [Polyangiaceae bacterium]|nr:flippase-like domain-containing protein [Polyangiaceae bacterium]
MSAAARRRLWLAARVLVSAGLVAWLASRIPIGEVGRALGQVPAIGVALALVVLIAQTLLGVLRWRRMLARTGAVVPVAALWSDVLVSSAYNMVLPSSVGGDVVRALRCARRLDEPHHAFSTTLFERLVGVVSLALVAVPGVALVPGGRGLLAPALGLAAVGVLALVAAPGPFRLLARLALARAPTVASFSEGVERDLRGPLGGPGARAEAFAWSVAYQLAGISILSACVLPLGDGRLLLAIYAGVPLVVVAAMAPVSVAGLGLRESLFVTILGRLGVDRPMALALALLWLGSYLVLAALGLAAMWLLPPPPPPTSTPEGDSEKGLAHATRAQ